MNALLLPFCSNNWQELLYHPYLLLIKLSTGGGGGMSSATKFVQIIFSSSHESHSPDSLIWSLTIVRNTPFLGVCSSFLEVLTFYPAPLPESSLSCTEQQSPSAQRAPLNSCLKSFLKSCTSHFASWSFQPAATEQSVAVDLCQRYIC